MSIVFLVDGQNTGKNENSFRTGMRETGIWDRFVGRRKAGKSQGFYPISGLNHDLEIGFGA
jgi:hypothetical protein